MRLEGNLPNQLFIMYAMTVSKNRELKREPVPVRVRRWGMDMHESHQLYTSCL